MTGITLTIENGGHITTCQCGWIRHATTRAQAETNRTTHANKCKGPKTAPAPQTPKPAPRVKWDDREGATWIDSM